MTAATNYVTAMPIEDTVDDRLEENSDAGEEDSETGRQRYSDEYDHDHEDESPPLPATPDDAVYCNKQLTAHLIKKVCSRRRPNFNNNGNATSSNSSSNRSSAIGSNGNIASINNNNGLAPYYERSHSASTRSHSPDEAGISIRQHQLQQPHHQQQTQPDSQQRDSIDSGGGYLSASSASALSGLTGASSTYVSPFALSPLNEESIGLVRSSPWSRPAISLDVIDSPRTAELERVLFTLCDEFEERLHGKFDSFSSRLDTEPATIRESVSRELETLFYDDNVHWGRIIAVFVLTKEICDKCLAEGRPQLAKAVQQWVAEFFDQHLWRWVRQNQGWYGLVKFYKETGGDRAGELGGSGGSIWQSMALLLTLSAVSLAIALTASYFRR